MYMYLEHTLSCGTVFKIQTGNNKQLLCSQAQWNKEFRHLASHRDQITTK